MMTKTEMMSYLEQLNNEAQRMSIKGEICLYGGAVMCVVYDARPSTKDIDAVFKPAQELREAVKRVAMANQLRENWLNDAVKGFVVPHPQRVFLNMSNLRVFVPEPDYLLAMKSLSARADATDKQDLQFLINLMRIDNATDVFSILEKYYPKRQIKPATQYFIEELFES